MLRALKSWRQLRGLAFAISFVIDGYAFYIARPFTPESFQSAGIIAALLFLLFAELALQMRGRGRIRAALDDDESVVYQVGQHLLVLLRKIHASRMARRAIWWPVRIAALTSVVLLGWAAWKAGLSWLQPVYGAFDARYLFAGYMPLLIAIPFVLENVAEWRSHQYAMAVDPKSQDARLLIHSGVLMYDLQTVSLEHTIATRVIQSFSDTLIAIGDVELHEMGGTEVERFVDVWRPRRLAKWIQHSITAGRRRHVPRAA